MSIDIGTIEDARANTETRVRNLQRQGLIPIKPYELIAALEYSMSPEARHAQSKQVVIGINGESLSRTNGTNAYSQSAMFSHVLQLFASRSDANRNAECSLVSGRNAKDPVERQAWITNAISEKIGSLVASNSVKTALDRPLTELGLDSLLAIDLKNWIAKEFQTPFPASEILDHQNIVALAETVASKWKPIEQTQDGVSGKKPDQASDQQGPSPANHSSFSTKDELSKLPLPELRNTLQMYLRSREFFLSPEELIRTSKAIEQFMTEGGLGQKLQERLRQRSHDPLIDSWQMDLYTKDIYLKRRDPVHPFYTFYCGHLVGRVHHSQVRRAAVLSHAAFSYKQHIQAGTVEQEFSNGEPLCMESLKWLFNTVRQPNTGVDKWQRHPENDYLVALRHGHIFKVQLKNKRGRASVEALEAAFLDTLVCSESVVPSVAALTADERDIWAEMRDSVISLYPRNKAIMSMIEAAAFLICLDDGSPSTPSERSTQFFLGKPSNRWSDKSLQFIVCHNGASAFVCEHTMLDGMSVRSFNRFLTQKSFDPIYNPPGEGQALTQITDKTDDQDHNTDIGVIHEEYEIKLSTTMIAHITEIEERFHKRFPSIEIVHSDISNLGSDFFRHHKLPSKAALQIILQLACLIFYGHQPASWETISTSHFLKGRVDWIQAVQRPVGDFCAQARNSRLPPADRKVIFHEAVATHANTATQIARGHGFKAHLHALHAALEEGEEMPELFRDQAWKDTRVQTSKTVKTDCLEGAMVQETAFLLAEPDDIFVHYEVEEHRCIFFVQTWPGKDNRFCKAFVDATAVVKEILAAETKH